MLLGKRLIFLLLIGWMVVSINPAARAQDIPAVNVQDLKSSPQRYWAGFFVFNDVLKENPGEQTIRVEKRTLTRFQTAILGDVYAEPEALPLFESLQSGDEYLFVGTVIQRPRSFFGLAGKSKFVIVVRDITPFQKDTKDVPRIMDIIARENTTNMFNQTFLVLDDIIKSINKELYGYATANNLSLADVMGQKEHRDKIAASVRTALRRFEDRNRANSQEFFVQLIISIIAYQNGLVELASPAYVPEDLQPAGPESLEAPAMETEPETPESWDQSKPDVPADGNAINEEIKPDETSGDAVK